MYIDTGGEHLPGIMKIWIPQDRKKQANKQKTPKLIASVLFPSLSGSCARRDLLRPPGVAGAPLTPGTFRALGGRRGGGAMRHWTRGLGIRGNRAALPGPGYTVWRRGGRSVSHQEPPWTVGEPHAGSARAPASCPCCLALPPAATNDLGSISFPFV